MKHRFEDHIDGVHGNSRNTLEKYPQYVGVLRWINEAYEKALATIGSGDEGAGIFAGMSHAAFLGAMQLATSGQIPPAVMVLRGCIEDAIYGHFLFHHSELKDTWVSRHDDEAARSKVRSEFTIGRMKKFLREQNGGVADQFDLVYDASIDYGAHPNAMVLFAHLDPPDEAGNHIWKYINLADVDLRFTLRFSAMAGLCALNILRLAFAKEFDSSGADEALYEAHEQYGKLPSETAGA